MSRVRFPPGSFEKSFVDRAITYSVQRASDDTSSDKRRNRPMILSEISDLLLEVLRWPSRCHVLKTTCQYSVAGQDDISGAPANSFPKQRVLFRASAY